MQYIVATFYHFFDFADYTERQSDLLKLLNDNHLKGSLLIASEGFNGTLSGTREAIDATLNYLKQEIVRSNFEHKESVHNRQPFGKAKVRLKKETISLGEPCPADMRGEYVEAKDWNDLISDPDTIVLDTRNKYETYLGTFKNAIDPNTQNFRQLPDFVRKNLKGAKHKKIATFCTGGIRCEKFTAWMKNEGFEQVYHLKGGILKYLEEVPAEKSLWNGECYVFDERVAVGHGLVASSTASSCDACGHTLTPEDRKHPMYVKNEKCGFCSD